MNVEQIVPLIHATPTKAVLYITGGGTEVLPMLLVRGGGSATLLSARVPYANAETAELLGGEPEKYVSETTTRQLAMAAFQKALALRTGDEPVIGVACSSSLQKTPEERKGRIHHIFAALQTNSKTVSISVTIDPATMDSSQTIAMHDTPDGTPFLEHSPVTIRKWEETLNAIVVFNLIAEGCGIKERASVPGRYDFKADRHESKLGGSYLPLLLEGKINRLAFYVDGDTVTPSPTYHRDDPYSSFIMPGSYNPAHEGHFEMADYVARELIEMPNYGIDFEISIRNVEKPMLDLISLEERLKSIGKGGKRKVWLTNAPTFVEKAKVFRNPYTTFIVGYDTAIRICNPKYAGDVDAVMDVFYENDTRFVVFGREMNGVFHPGFGRDITAEEAAIAAETDEIKKSCLVVYREPDTDEIPQRFTTICIAVTEPLPNRHVSSSGIRSKSSDGHAAGIPAGTVPAGLEGCQTECQSN